VLKNIIEPVADEVDSMNVERGPITSDNRPPNNHPNANVWLINPNRDMTLPRISSRAASWNIVRRVFAHQATTAPLTPHAIAAANRDDVSENAIMDAAQMAATMTNVRARRVTCGTVISEIAPIRPPTPPAARMKP
jgi:hypothetical protein